MKCSECGKDVGDPVGSIYSNTGKYIGPVNTNHTGDIYRCENCECFWLDDFIYKCISRWSG